MSPRSRRCLAQRVQLRNFVAWDLSTPSLFPALNVLITSAQENAHVQRSGNSWLQAATPPLPSYWSFFLPPAKKVLFLEKEKSCESVAMKRMTGGCCAPKCGPAQPSEAPKCCSPGSQKPAASSVSCTPQNGSAATSKGSSCCPPKTSSAIKETVAPSPVLTVTNEVSHSDVSEYYGKTIQKQDDLLTSACILDEEVSKDVRQLIRNIHPEILDKFYGCGSPIPPLLKGATVLDLGCGTGRDVYTAAQLVGASGRVIGVDMTEEQLAVARSHEEWQRAKFGFEKSNVAFQRAFIEDLKSAGVADESVDVVISNCVINLAPAKEPVLREIQRVLKPGGELYFSDVYCDRRVPEHLKNDKVLFGECLSGALYLEDFRRLMAKVGLPAWGMTTSRRINVTSDKIAAQVGDIGFYSITVRAVKVPADEAEDSPEDYGQVAVYRGTIPSYPDAFVLDQVRTFPTNVPVPVDSTTAAMLQASRYSPAFEVSAKGAHYGPFTLWSRPLASQAGGHLGGEALRQLAKAEPAAACC